MPNELPIPPELQKLIEKREAGDRRKEIQEEEVKNLKDDRRKLKDRRKNC